MVLGHKSKPNLKKNFYIGQFWHHFRLILKAVGLFLSVGHPPPFGDSSGFSGIFYLSLPPPPSSFIPMGTQSVQFPLSIKKI